MRHRNLALLNCAMVKAASSYLSPGAAFMSGAAGGPMGAGIHGATGGNGMNEASRSLLMAALLGGGGLVGGAALGGGIGGAVGRRAAGQIMKGAEGGALPFLRSKAEGAMTEGAHTLLGGAAGGIAGGAAGYTGGAGLGAMQSAQNHDNRLSMVKRLLHHLGR